MMINCRLLWQRSICAESPKYHCYSRIYYFGHACSKLNVLIARLTGKCATHGNTYAILAYGHVHITIIYYGHINPLTAGVAYIRVFIFYKHIKYHILNMLKIKCDINQ